MQSRKQKKIKIYQNFTIFSFMQMSVPTQPPLDPKMQRCYQNSLFILNINYLAVKSGYFREKFPLKCYQYILTEFTHTQRICQKKMAIQMNVLSKYLRFLIIALSSDITNFFLFFSFFKIYCLSSFHSCLGTCLWVDKERRSPCSNLKTVR